MYEMKIEKFSDEEAPETRRARGHMEKHSHLLREMVRVERRTAVQLRNEGAIDDDLLRQLERELDLTEERLTIAHQDPKRAEGEPGQPASWRRSVKKLRLARGWERARRTTAPRGRAALGAELETERET